MVENKTKGKLQKQICQVVLDHFEKQYTAELGDKWTSVRDVLTCPSCWQYAILLNKFSQSTELENTLRVKGYHLAFRGTLPYLPRSLKCYISRTPRRFPAQKHQTGKLKEYYLLNAASVLPVLALEVKDGEDVLDLCAAPGGKSVTILQCAYPGQFHCNEYDDLRSRWLKQTMESFIPDPLVNLITVSKQDGRQIGDFKPESYDKVLVDAPCSNDRSWLFSSDTQQAKLRLIQRKELSSLQFQLLSSRNNSACGKTPHLSGLLSLGYNVPYIYICVCVCVCIYICVYIYMFFFLTCKIQVYNLLGMNEELLTRELHSQLLSVLAFVKVMDVLACFGTLTVTLNDLCIVLFTCLKVQSFHCALPFLTSKYKQVTLALGYSLPAYSAVALSVSPEFLRCFTAKLL
ncbi:tRNA (cytosine(34)-C(5))-methyltransferase, mitochondrial isoform X2 [Anser cygnoides]|uniref:tRNA (cytosine(34)-C(5))-methyltransferase, mitochondrial isoform X2 n=1 Tax=Anser cygnoides TaxID=8845 RepID=UPI0034D1606D